MTQLTFDLAPLLPLAQAISPAQWQACVNTHWLNDFDVAMAQWLARHAPDAPEALLWLTALLARQSGQGHVRLELADVLANPACYGLDSDAAMDARNCLKAYSVDALQQLIADSSAVAIAELSPKPLVLDADALYWQRAWREECDVAERLNARLSTSVTTDAQALEQLIDALFTRDASNQDQRAACRLAAQRCLSVITGGPGTGKTTTVVRVLAILQSLAESAGKPPLRIALAAPTGKAAARLSESIASQVAKLPISQHIADSIPTDVSTVHRLLGVMSQDTGQRYRHHLTNPLALDVLVVDEASMLDLSLMAALMEALPTEARVILLGDKDQLASVEAGAVLADLCSVVNTGSSGELTPTLPAEKAPAHVAQLQQSFRFDAQRGIGKLAQAVRTGQAQSAPNEDDYAPEVRRVDSLQTLFAGYDAYWASVQSNEAAEHILKRFDSFRLLCALREGSHGVIALNAACEHYLRKTYSSDNASLWYVGRPVMITRNDYSLRLMNGDIGICLQAPDSNELRVAFWDGSAQAIRWLLPSRLPTCETVFAMTVHKSQGSEFTKVAVVLPTMHSPVLSRELIYTALTRARDAVELCIPKPAVWRQAIDTQARRFSGLRQRLLSSN
ncbi:MAG: exodeoxyribonuclease V subunit alpha [Paraperlucidibaca sp.]